MATNKYIGTDGVYSTDGNWSLGAKPSAGQDVIMPATATGTAIAGYDASAVSLASYTEEPGFALNVGTAIAPLKIQATVTALSGTGTRYYGGTISPAVVGGSVFLDAGATTVAITMTGGTVLSLAAITTATIAGGVLTHGIAGETTTAITTANIINTGTVIFNSTASSAFVVKRGGTLDLTGDTRVMTTPAITLYNGGTVNDVNNRIPATNNITKGDGGSISIQ